MIREVITQVRLFYRECDKPTFFFALAIVNQVVGFTPGIPSVFFYAIMIGYSFYCLRKSNSIMWPLGIFILYIPIGLLVTTPDPIFKSWERYFLFVTLMISASSLLKGKQLTIYRNRIFQIVLFSCAVLGIGSFFCRFIGINFGASNQSHLISVGNFGGLCNHSMLLGPIAGVGAIFMVKLFYQTRKKFYLLMSILCLFSVIFSASRASLLASLVGIIVMLYKQSGTASKFMQAIVLSVILGALSFPLWEHALDDVLTKQEANVSEGSMFDSRSQKWMARLEEFEESPVFGVGFVAVNLFNKQSMHDVDYSTGTVETGSSWLCILSMTGLLGALCLFPVFINAYWTAWKSKKVSPVIVGVLTLFYIHMCAEGYVLAGGSFLTFILWLTVGLAYSREHV